MLSKLIKSVLVVVILGVSILQFSSCSSKNDEPKTKKETLEIKKKQNDYIRISSILRLLYHSNHFVTNEEVSDIVSKDFQVPKIPVSRGLSTTSNNASFTAKQTLEEMKSIDPSLYLTKELYVNKLLDIINANEKSLSLSEKNALILTAHVSADMIELRYGNSNSDLKGIGEWLSSAGKWIKKQWKSWGKCVAGIIGKAGEGALAGAGAGVGTTIPALGTGAGAVIGGVAGAIDGAYEAC